MQNQVECAIIIKNLREGIMKTYKIPMEITTDLVINGEKHELVLRRFEPKDIHRIFMAWNNPQSYRYNAIDWDENCILDISKYSHPSEFGMYYMVLEDKTIGEIVGTCRFGDYNWTSDNTDIWGFGYCVFRGDDKEFYSVEDIRKTYEKNGLFKDTKFQNKGYGQKMLSMILEFAEKKGIKKIRDGADINNDGSLKVMIKNGFTHLMQEDKEGNPTSVDEDFDYEFSLDLTNGIPAMLDGKDKERAYKKLDKMREIDNKRFRKEKQDLDNRHKAKSYLYLILTKILNCAKETSKSVILDVYNSLSEDEQVLLFAMLEDRYNAWSKNKDEESWRNCKLLTLIKTTLSENARCSEN